MKIRTAYCLVTVLCVLLCAKAAAEYEIGSYVTFGTYPQTREGNDMTPIEWLVLARDGDNVLLLSRYGLDARPYHHEYTNVTWEECALRAWLNGDFLDRAFSAEEQKSIVLTKVSNDRYQNQVGTNHGNDTQDRVFLLSWAEAERYVGANRYDVDNTRTRTAPTEYAEQAGAHANSEYRTADGKAACWWWLRSNGIAWASAECVRSRGTLSSSNVHIASACVRPAIWINLGS